MVLANDVAPSFSSDLLASRRSKILCQTCSVDSVGLDPLLSELVTPESGDAWVKLSSTTRTPLMAAASLAATAACTAGNAAAAAAAGTAAGPGTRVGLEPSFGRVRTMF